MVSGLKRRVSRRGPTLAEQCCVPRSVWLLTNTTGSSAAASPAATSTPDGKDKDVKPKSVVKSETQAQAQVETGNGQGHGEASQSKPDSTTRESGSPQLQLSLIDSTRTTPRTAKSDGMAGKILTEDGGDNVRDKCAEMMYDALAIDSTAGEWSCHGVAWRGEAREPGGRSERKSGVGRRGQGRLG